MQVGGSGMSKELQRAIAAACQASYEAGKQDGLKAVGEWGEERCPHEVDTLPNFTKRECPQCWQALKGGRVPSE